MPWPRKVEKGSSNKDRFHWVRKSACAAVTSEPRQQLAQQCPLCDLMPSQSPWQKEQVQISHACHYTLNQPWSSDLKQSKQRHYYEHMYTDMYCMPGHKSPVWASKLQTTGAGWWSYLLSTFCTILVCHACSCTTCISFLCYDCHEYLSGLVLGIIVVRPCSSPFA